jgi:hypothetical protein
MGSHPTLAQQQLATEALELDHRDWIHDHHRMAERTAEQAFDRLNPDFGVPADRYHHSTHQDVQDREAGLSLGTRVAIHTMRQTTATRSSGSPTRTTA